MPGGLSSRDRINSRIRSGDNVLQRAGEANLSESEVPASHANVQQLAAELGLSRAAYRRAVELAGFTADRADWRRYIDYFLMAAGVLLIVAGVAAFFAWNWADLGRVQKFALIQGGVLLAVLVACRRGLDTIPGRATLLAAGGLVGVLLAYFGQTYQTGADPYGLFLGWAILILPWALVGRQAGLWMLLLALANLAFVMYWTQVLNPPAGWWELATLLGPLVWLGFTVMDSELASCLFAINVLALLAWELLAAWRRPTWMRGRWFPRAAAALALATVVAPTIAIIFVASLGERLYMSLLSPALFVVTTTACLWHYRRRHIDLPILTCCLTGGILVLTSLAVRYVLGDALTMLLLALFLVGQVAAASWWLRGVARDAEALR